MRLTDAIASLQLGKKKERHAEPLSTVWSEKGTSEDEVPFWEYPRPQLRRDHWICLNGWWDYSMGPAGRPYGGADGKILVPFSPETERSGVRKVLGPGESLWYARRIRLQRPAVGRRMLLHFGAVDERCAVWWNGRLLGKHRNGYLPFSFDVTEYVHDGDNEIRICVKDDSDAGTACRGKQRLAPGGMFYQAQSGIWQTVWLEEVPENYIKALTATAEPGERKAQISVTMHAPAPVQIECGGHVYAFGAEQFGADGTALLEIPLENAHLWSPEDPFLYDISVAAGEDHVKSYFAVRSFGTGTDEQGIPRLLLNGKPYFMNGILDQGYWPESLLTPPSDAAMIFDIEGAKRLGFNMIRKHEKTEPARWYYHCDRLGMIVWQDMPHGGGRINSMLMTYLPTLFPWLGRHLSDRLYVLFGRADRKARVLFGQDLAEMIRLMKGYPCIALWGIFNEGWGQFDSLRLEKLVRQEDPTRLIDHASGWFDQGGGDIRSGHNYFRKLAVKREKRPFVLSEYGGCTCGIPGHVMYSETYGYHDYTEEELPKAYGKLMEEIRALEERGLAAAVYTQLSDIEEETNGLFTYDRKKCKISLTGS